MKVEKITVVQGRNLSMLQSSFGAPTPAPTASFFSQVHKPIASNNEDILHSEYFNTGKAQLGRAK